MDEDKDGRFTLEELINFGKFCNDQSLKFKGYEFQFQLQAQSTICLWQSVQKGDEDDFTAWVGRLLYENTGVQYFDSVPDIPFVRIETVKLLYDILDMKLLNSFSLQNFFNLLQHAAEER